MYSNRTITRGSKVPVLVVAVALLCVVISAQQDERETKAGSVTVYGIGHSQYWPHIASPPREGSKPNRALAWPAESQAFTRALDALKRAWNSEIPKTAGDLKFEDRQYEDLVLAVTSAGGFGNLVLADTARRLDLFLLCGYAVLHPTDHAAVADILAGRRVHLLSADATGDMVSEELHLPPPHGQWHLSEGDLGSLLRANGSTLAQESKSMVLFPPGPDSTLTSGSVNFLLYRLAMDDETEISTLPCLLLFLRRGGDPLKTRIGELIDFDKDGFDFPATGVTRFVAWTEVGALIDRIRKTGGRGNPFEMIVGLDRDPFSAKQ